MWIQNVILKGKEVMEYKIGEIKLLKDTLDDMQYELLYGFIVNQGELYVNPFHDFYSMRSEMKKFDSEIQEYLSFFALGEAIAKHSLERILPLSVINYLYNIEIMNQDNDSYWLNSYVLIPYCNCYFFASTVHYYPTCQSPYPQPYIGLDSYWLSRVIVNRLHGEVLDLCTGSGIQAILAAKTAKKVVAVDIDASALEFAKFNAYLNEVNEIIEFREGDLYTTLQEDEKFDYILSNPPFIPIPEEMMFPICGNGGIDGKKIVNRIMEGYNTYLKDGGRGIMIGQCLGNKTSSFLSEDIRKICANKKSTAYYWSRVPIGVLFSGVNMLSKSFEQNNDMNDKDWKQLYERLGVNIFYIFNTIVHNVSGELKEIYVDDHCNEDDMPVSLATVSDKVSENYLQKSKKNTSVLLNDEQMYFLSKLDGKKTIKEIVYTLPLKYKVKHSSETKEVLLASYLELCSHLSRNGMIE